MFLYFFVSGSGFSVGSKGYSPYDMVFKGFYLFWGIIGVFGFLGFL